MSVQSKAQKDTLLAIQKNACTEYALESLFGTRYQGKVFFSLAVRPFDTNADFSLVSKFWILGDDRCRDRLVDKLVVHTTHDEYHEPAIVGLMENDIREELNAERETYNTPQKFFKEYAKRHEKEFGEQWELDKADPIW